MNFTIPAEIKLISISVDFFSKWSTQNDQKKNSLQVVYVICFSHLKCSWNVQEFFIFNARMQKWKKRNIHQEEVGIVKVLWYKM